MNKCTIIGNLTRDPETRQTKSGDVTQLSVAVNRRDGEADFFRVSCWGKLGENCAKYLSKGKKVCAVGPVSASAYETQDGDIRASLDIFAESVEFLSPADHADDDKPQNSRRDSNRRR